jgi:hypothetical protein
VYRAPEGCFFLISLNQSYKLVVVVEGTVFGGQATFSFEYQALTLCATLFTPTGLSVLGLGTKSSFDTVLWITMELLESYSQSCV